MEAVIKNPNIPPRNKLRLAILYALRYQKSRANDIANLVNLLLKEGMKREDVQVCISIQAIFPAPWFQFD